MKSDKQHKNEGVVVYGSIADAAWFRNPSAFLAASWLLLAARKEDGEDKGVALSRGELATTIREIGENTGLSAKKTRNALETLRKAEFITTRVEHKKTVVTIVNYRKYQDLGKEGKGKILGKIFSSAKDYATDTCDPIGDQAGQDFGQNISEVSEQPSEAASGQGKIFSSATNCPTDNCDPQDGRQGQNPDEGKGKILGNILGKIFSSATDCLTSGCDSQDGQAGQHFGQHFGQNISEEAEKEVFLFNQGKNNQGKYIENIDQDKLLFNKLNNKNFNNNNPTRATLEPAQGHAYARSKAENEERFKAFDAELRADSLFYERTAMSLHLPLDWVMERFEDFSAEAAASMRFADFYDYRRACFNWFRKESNAYHKTRKASDYEARRARLVAGMEKSLGEFL